MIGFMLLSSAGNGAALLLETFGTVAADPSLDGPAAANHIHGGESTEQGGGPEPGFSEKASVKVMEPVKKTAAEQAAKAATMAENAKKKAEKKQQQQQQQEAAGGGKKGNKGGKKKK